MFLPSLSDWNWSRPKNRDWEKKFNRVKGMGKLCMCVCVNKTTFLASAPLYMYEVNRFRCLRRHWKSSFRLVYSWRYVRPNIIFFFEEKKIGYLLLFRLGFMNLIYEGKGGFIFRKNIYIFIQLMPPKFEMRMVKGECFAVGGEKPRTSRFCLYIYTTWEWLPRCNSISRKYALISSAADRRLRVDRSQNVFNPCLSGDCKSLRPLWKIGNRVHIAWRSQVPICRARGSTMASQFDIKGALKVASRLSSRIPVPIFSSSPSTQISELGGSLKPSSSRN